MQGFICVFGVLELPVFVTLRPGFWQFSPMRT
ncbi:transposase, partial [Xanthomonas oryzae pv. oryzae]